MPELVIFIILLALGYGVGRYAENKHYRSILSREAELNQIPAIATKLPPLTNEKLDSTLVTGSVVISIDFFKQFISVLRNLVGGRVTSYETLIDRARREAILRMKEQAQSLNAKMVFNIKLETSSIYKGRRNAIGSVEVLAYGTAFIPVQD